MLGCGDDSPPTPPTPPPAPPTTVPTPVDPAALDPAVRAHLEQLAGAVKANASGGDSWLAYADSLLAHSEPAAAAQAYQGAMATLPDGDLSLERAAYLRGLALDESTQSAAALEAIATLATRSKQAHVHWRLALLLAADGQLESALTAAGRAVSLDPRDMRARAAVAQVASEAGDWETAEGAARVGLRMNPRNGHLYGILAAALRAQGKPEEAARYSGAGRFTRADWLDPWLQDLRALRLGEAAAQDRFYGSLGAGQLDAARAALATVEASPSAAPSRTALMRAQVAVAAGDVVLAAAAADSAAELGATSCELALVRASIDAKKAIGPAALDGIVRMLEASPCEGDNESARLELIGNLKLVQREFPEGVDALLAADRAREVGITPTLKRAASTLEKEMEYAQAARLAHRFYEAEPLNPEACFLLTVISLRSGDIEGARRWGAELAALAPNNPTTKQLLAEIGAASAAK